MNLTYLTKYYKDHEHELQAVFLFCFVSNANA